MASTSGFRSSEAWIVLRSGTGSVRGYLQNQSANRYCQHQRIDVGLTSRFFWLLDINEKIWKLEASLSITIIEFPKRFFVDK